MFISARKIGIALLGSMLVSGTAWSAGIQGNVTGPNGKTLKGAEVRIERKDKKAQPIVTTTDGKGAYKFASLDIGVYELTAAANGMTAKSGEIKTRADGSVRVDFDLKSGTAKKKKTHKVWVAGNTGSNLGGSWVEVADDENAPVSADNGANPVDRAGGNSVRKMQQMGGGNSRGGN
jgi:hypothetical protein